MRGRTAMRRSSKVPAPRQKRVPGGRAAQPPGGGQRRARRERARSKVAAPAEPRPTKSRIGAQPLTASRARTGLRRPWRRIAPRRDRTVGRAAVPIVICISIRYTRHLARGGLEDIEGRPASAVGTDGAGGHQKAGTGPAVEFELEISHQIAFAEWLDAIESTWSFAGS